MSLRSRSRNYRTADRRSRNRNIEIIGDKVDELTDYISENKPKKTILENNGVLIAGAFASFIAGSAATISPVHDNMLDSINEKCKSHISFVQSDKTKSNMSADFLNRQMNDSEKYIDIYCDRKLGFFEVLLSDSEKYYTLKPINKKRSE